MKRYEVTIHQERTFEYEEVFTVSAENEEQAEFLALVKAEEDGFDGGVDEGEEIDISDFAVSSINEVEVEDEDAIDEANEMDHAWRMIPASEKKAILAARKASSSEEAVSIN